MVFYNAHIQSYNKILNIKIGGKRTQWDKKPGRLEWTLIHLICLQVLNKEFAHTVINCTNSTNSLNF